MKIIEPNVEYWTECSISNIDHIARCARICYRSEKGDNNKLVSALRNNKHLSMFRHSTKYFIIPVNYLTDLAKAKYFDNNPYINYVIEDLDIFISTNEQYINEHNDFYNLVAKYERSIDDMFNIAWKYKSIYDIIRYTFKVTTQISTSRELNRVSPNNIAEQSTRYVYDDGTICKPHWITDEEVEIYNEEYDKGLNNSKMNFTPYLYFTRCEHVFEGYKTLIENNINKQDARGILPLDTATVCVYTYSGREWRHILDLRYRGTTGKPHPNAYIIGEMIHNQLQILTKGQVE